MGRTGRQTVKHEGGAGDAGSGQIAGQCFKRAGYDTLIGAAGVVERIDGDASWARVQGESWRVRASTGLSVGQTVRVTAVDGLTLDVEPTSNSNAPPLQGGTA